MSINRDQWPRCIAHIDMVAFFASIEQMDDPTLQGKPVAVINSQQGTTFITAGYEARAYGIRTGTKLKAAKALCPAVVVKVSRPAWYAEISGRIFYALAAQITPDLEQFSIDEAFLDLTPVMSHYPTVEAMAEKIHTVVAKASGGLQCSIGISEGKLTAKFCAKQRKGGITIVPPEQMPIFMQDREVADICGVGDAFTQYLYQHGIKYCREMKKLPMSVLAKKMGNQGKRLYLVSQGHDPEPLKLPAAPKSFSHSKLLPPNTQDYAKVNATLHLLADRLCQRMRANGYKTESVAVEAKTANRTHQRRYPFPVPTNQSSQVWQAIQHFIASCHGEGLFSVTIRAGKLQSAETVQGDLFDAVETVSPIEQVRDAIRERFGKNLVHTADTLLLSDSANPVISPAWRAHHDGEVIKAAPDHAVNDAVQKILAKAAQQSLRQLRFALNKHLTDENQIDWLLKDQLPDRTKIAELLSHRYAKALNHATDWASQRRLAVKLGRHGFDYADIFAVIQQARRALS